MGYSEEGIKVLSLSRGAYIPVRKDRRWTSNKTYKLDTSKIILDTGKWCGEILVISCSVEGTPTEVVREGLWLEVEAAKSRSG